MGRRGDGDGAGGAGRRPPERKYTPSRRSLRLTFRYRGDEVELVSIRRVTMVAPPSDPVGAMEPRSGFCVELRTPRERVVYRRFGRSPIQTSVEVPSEEPGSFSRLTVAEPKGAFVLVVPAMDEARDVVLLGDEPSRGRARTKKARARAGLQPIARFDLTSPGPGRSAS